MRIAIIALAGVSSRFNDNECEKVLKGIYTITDYRKTLLYEILKKCGGLDRVVIVGGYKYEELVAYVDRCKADFAFEIVIVFNSKFKQLGTGYTLKMGLKQCVNESKCSEIILIEGDLFFDEYSFNQIKMSDKSVATYNFKPIESDKSVIGYINKDNSLKYVFSNEHSMVQIMEPFWQIFNSGQIWKFANVEIVRKMIREENEEFWNGTNLRFIEDYFSRVSVEKREILLLETWENCNTRDDYYKCAKQM